MAIEPSLAIPYAELNASTSLPPTPRPLSRSLSPSVHSPSLPTPWTAREHSRSPADFASSPPWISNPPHPKLNHLPSFLLNPSNHSHDPHLAGNPGFPGRQFEFRPKLDLVVELHRPATISSVQGLESTVSKPLMLVLPSFLHVHVVSMHVLDKVILTATGRTSPTRSSLLSSRASPMPACTSSSRWCSVSVTPQVLITCS